MLPTDDQAFQFAIMLQAGLPANQAILYFTDSSDPGEIAMLMSRWLKCKAVRMAQTRLTGKAWQEMTLDERCKAALDQHYSGMAWLLFSSHYADASALDKGKLDSARMALESKLAGTAGKQDALSQFFSDINTGKVKLKQGAATH